VACWLAGWPFCFFAFLLCFAFCFLLLCFLCFFAFLLFCFLLSLLFCYFCFYCFFAFSAGPAPPPRHENDLLEADSLPNLRGWEFLGPSHVTVG